MVWVYRVHFEQSDGESRCANGRTRRSAPAAGCFFSGRDLANLLRPRTTRVRCRDALGFALLEPRLQES
jgi:hypothetical protein